MARLKERVLELSIKQINEHTDITVKYEQHKKVDQFQVFF
jgi:plasmid replication initiation protein